MSKSLKLLTLLSLFGIFAMGTEAHAQLDQQITIRCINTYQGVGRAGERIAQVARKLNTSLLCEFGGVVTYFDETATPPDGGLGYFYYIPPNLHPGVSFSGSLDAFLRSPDVTVVDYNGQNPAASAHGVQISGVHETDNVGATVNVGNGTCTAVSSSLTSTSTELPGRAPNRSLTSQNRWVCKGK